MTTKENVKNVPEEERNIFGNDQIGTITDNLYNRNIKNLRVPAFEGLGECVDYKTFFDAVDTYAKAFLEMGVKENDVVTLCLAGTLDAIINFYALNKIGAVANFVNPNYFKINSKKYINGTDSKLLIVMDRFYPILKDAISETDVEKVVLSSLTEYSSLLYKMMIKKQDIKKDQLIDGIDYYTLPEFIKMGEKSNKTIDKRNYVKEQPAALVYTSGSTGDPKGVLLTNDSFNNMISIYAEKDGFGSTVGDRNMLLIPPMYGTSLCHCINTPLAFGCTTVLQPIYNPAKFSEDLLKYEPKIVTASKAHYISLLRADLKKDQTKFLRMPFTGGEPITEKLATDINNRLNYLGSPNLMLAYGMSELGTMATINMDLENRVNESGYLLPHLKAKIVDPITGEEVKPNEKGDLLISSPCRMKEYYKNEEATSAFFITDADGTKWARTGDIATVSEDGVYNVIGRKKDSYINEKGEVIYLFQIENLVESTEDVQECEVVPLTVDGKKVSVVHVVLKHDTNKNPIDVIKGIDEVCKESPDILEKPYAYKVRDSFQISPISGKRDYETLKYETDDYLMVTNDGIIPTSIDSEESKISNEVEDVKKLKLTV